MQHPFRKVPAVEKVLQALGGSDLPRPLLAALVRTELARARAEASIPELGVIVSRVQRTMQTLLRARIHSVINGAGIMVHTNLGRSPLGTQVVEKLSEVASRYSNLEYDLNAGQRGSRAGYLEQALALLCEAEAATAVNNCAAALVLVTRHFTRKRPEVVISRGELVQIGGGFRIPEILEASGARLREVGTTNRTTVADYAAALGSETGLVLKVHRSNFYMEGFVESPSTSEVAALTRRKRIPFVEDLGSGAIAATERYGFQHEPTPAEALRRGVDLILFSGDKLMGGPQAGIIAGRSKLITALKRDPFYRALRCDKLILSALEATADTYLKEGEDASLPILAMARVPMRELEARSEKLLGRLTGLPARISAGKGQAQMGGGALPHSKIPSVTLDLVPEDMALEELAERLRHGIPPVIGYIANARFKLDLRTVFPDQDQQLAIAIRNALTPPTAAASDK